MAAAEKEAKKASRRDEAQVWRAEDFYADFGARPPARVYVHGKRVKPNPSASGARNPRRSASRQLTGWDAIRVAEDHGWLLSKYADPTEGARRNLTPDEARDIAREDPGLIYLPLKRGNPKARAARRAPRGWRRA